MAKGLIFLIKIYQFLISPYLGTCCRFLPSCSEYAIEAFKKHGLVKGLRLSCCRLMRCHPGSPGGMDLVP